MKKILLLILPILFFACTDEKDYNTSSSNSKKTISINYPVLNNYLTFNDFDELENTIIELQSYDSIDVINWEDSHNFFSLNRISSEIEIAENELLVGYEDYTDEELSALPETHSSVFNEFIELLVKMNSDDSTFSYDMDINNYNYANIVNKDGIVKVGQDIYQYKSSTIKKIIGGDESKISLLASTTQTDYENGIEVINLVDNKKISAPFEYSPYMTKDGYKLILYHKFAKVYAYDNEYAYAYTIRLRSLRKFFGRSYINYSTNLNSYSNFQGNDTYGYFMSGSNRIYGYRNWSEDAVYSSRKYHTSDVEMKHNWFYIDGSDPKPQIYHYYHQVSAGGKSNISFVHSY